MRTWDGALVRRQNNIIKLTFQTLRSLTGSSERYTMRPTLPSVPPDLPTDSTLGLYRWGTRPECIRVPLPRLSGPLGTSTATRGDAFTVYQVPTDVCHLVANYVVLARCQEQLNHHTYLRDRTIWSAAYARVYLHLMSGHNDTLPDHARLARMHAVWALLDGDQKATFGVMAVSPRVWYLGRLLREDLASEWSRELALLPPEYDAAIVYLLEQALSAPRSFYLVQLLAAYPLTQPIVEQLRERIRELRHYLTPQRDNMSAAHFADHFVLFTPANLRLLLPVLRDFLISQDPAAATLVPLPECNRLHPPTHEVLSSAAVLLRSFTYMLNVALDYVDDGAYPSSRHRATMRDGFIYHYVVRYDAHRIFAYWHSYRPFTDSEVMPILRYALRAGAVGLARVIYTILLPEGSLQLDKIYQYTRCILEGEQQSTMWSDWVTHLRSKTTVVQHFTRLVQEIPSLLPHPQEGVPVLYHLYREFVSELRVEQIYDLIEKLRTFPLPSYAPLYRLIFAPERNREPEWANVLNYWWSKGFAQGYRSVENHALLLHYYFYYRLVQPVLFPFRVYGKTTYMTTTEGPSFLRGTWPSTTAPLGSTAVILSTGPTVHLYYNSQRVHIPFPSGSSEQLSATVTALRPGLEVTLRPYHNDIIIDTGIPDENWFVLTYRRGCVGK